MTLITRDDVLHPDANKRFECPVCGSDRGAALSLKNDKLVAHCHSKKCDIFDWLRERGWLPHTTHHARADPHDPGEEARDRLRRAVVILRAAHIANAGKPTDYLAARKIDVVPQGAMLMPREISRKVLGKNYPAMVAPVMDKDGHLLGAQVTLLSRDGKKRIKGQKRSYGNIAGGYLQLATPSPDRPLIVAEGIETALAGHQITGLPAIATLGTSGMKSVSIPECSEVIILADKGEAGSEAATVLAERAVQHRVTRIIAPQKEDDWADSLKKYHDAPDKLLALRRRIIKARKFSDKPRLRAFTREEFDALDIPPMQHFIKPALPVAGSCVLSGQKGNGKTRVVFSMAECIATKGKMLDWTSEVVGRVLIVDGELPSRTVKLRTSRMGPTDGNVLIISRFHQLERGVKMGKLTSQALRDEIDRVVEEDGINVIILDSFSSLIGESENDVEFWSQIEDWIMWHRGCGRSVLLIMHEGAVSGRARGRTRFIDNFDNVMRVEALPERHDEDPDYFYYLLEFTAIRDESDEDESPLRRQVVRVPKAGAATWEFVEVPEAKKTGPSSRNAERDDEIKKMHEGGAKAKELASLFKISRSRVVQICKGGE